MSARATVPLGAHLGVAALVSATVVPAVGLDAVILPDIGVT